MLKVFINEENYQRLREESCIPTPEFASVFNFIKHRYSRYNILTRWTYGNEEKPYGTFSIVLEFNSEHDYTAFLLEDTVISKYIVSHEVVL